MSDNVPDTTRDPFVWRTDECGAVAHCHKPAGHDGPHDAAIGRHACPVCRDRENARSLNAPWHVVVEGLSYDIHDATGTDFASVWAHGKRAALIALVPEMTRAILSAVAGGAVCTNDDACLGCLADRIREITARAGNSLPPSADNTQPVADSCTPVHTDAADVCAPVHNNAATAQRSEHGSEGSAP